MSDINPDLAAQEVDDELRRDRLNQLWKAYGRYVIAGAAGIVLAVGGTQLYKYQVRSGQEANSAKFSAVATQVAEEGADTQAAWTAVAGDLDTGYAALAEIRAAAALVQAGEFEDAVAAFDAIADGASGDKVLRQYAQLQAGMLTVGKLGDLENARARFGVLANQGEPWYFSAAEQLAYIDMKQGELEAALEKFSALADNTGAPQSISARARQFRDMLESQVTSNPVDAPAESDAAEGSYEG